MSKIFVRPKPKYRCPRCRSPEWWVAERRENGDLRRVRCKECKKKYVPSDLDRRKLPARPPPCTALIDAGDRWEVCGAEGGWWWGWDRDHKKRLCKCPHGHSYQAGEEAERHLRIQMMAKEAES